MRNYLKISALLVSFIASAVYADACKEVATHSDDQKVLSDCFEKLSLKKRYSKHIETHQTFTLSGEMVSNACYKGWFSNRETKKDVLLALCESTTYLELGTSVSYEATRIRDR